MAEPVPNESDHLIAARAGNAEAFSALVEPYRRPLLVHAYRMTGSLDDAEDVVQEALLRAWNKIDTYKAQGPLLNWLYVIATRLWLDEIRKRKKQVLLPLSGPPADPTAPPMPPAASAPWLDPLPGAWLAGVDPSAEVSFELRESVSFAFIVALQKLNPRQRVVLLMRAVFNWKAEEVAELLGLTSASVNNLLYRARKNLAVAQYEEVPAPKQNLDLFVNAWETGDIPTLISLLHDTATFAMPPMGVWYAGPAAIHQALENFVFLPQVKWKMKPTRANSRPAYGLYQGPEGTGTYQAFGLILPIFGAEDGKLAEITAFLSPELLARFDLPQSISP